MIDEEGNAEEEVKESGTVNWVFWEPGASDRMKRALDAMLWQTERDIERMEGKKKAK